MLIYRLAQVEGDEKSKDYVQLTVINANDAGFEAHKVVRMPKMVFLQMAASLEHNGLPYIKIEER